MQMLLVDHRNIALRVVAVCLLLASITKVDTMKIGGDAGGRDEGVESGDFLTICVDTLI